MCPNFSSSPISTQSRSSTPPHPSPYSFWLKKSWLARRGSVPPAAGTLWRVLLSTCPPGKGEGSRWKVQGSCQIRQSNNNKSKTDSRPSYGASALIPDTLLFYYCRVIAPLIKFWLSDSEAGWTFLGANFFHSLLSRSNTRLHAHGAL